VCRRRSGTFIAAVPTTPDRDYQHVCREHRHRPTARLMNIVWFPLPDRCSSGAAILYGVIISVLVRIIELRIFLYTYDICTRYTGMVLECSVYFARLRLHTKHEKPRITLPCNSTIIFRVRGGYNGRDIIFRTHFLHW